MKIKYFSIYSTFKHTCNHMTFFNLDETKRCMEWVWNVNGFMLPGNSDVLLIFSFTSIKIDIMSMIFFTQFPRQRIHINSTYYAVILPQQLTKLEKFIIIISSCSSGRKTKKEMRLMLRTRKHASYYIQWKAKCHESLSHVKKFPLLPIFYIIIKCWYSWCHCHKIWKLC